MTSVEVRTAREALGLSPAGLAEALGVSVRTVHHWEAGTRQPSATAAKLIGRMVEEYTRKRGK